MGESSPNDLSPPPPPPPKPTNFISRTRLRLQTHLSAPLPQPHLSLPILTCAFTSGLVDSTIYNAYGTFVSMQTGNTIFVGLGGASSLTHEPRSSTKPYGWAKSLVSIACFALGCFVFSRLTRWMGPRRRGTQFVNFGVQMGLTLLAAALIQAGVVRSGIDPPSSSSSSSSRTDVNPLIQADWHSLIPISLLSFQASGQIVASRALDLSEVPTVVLTSMLHDIASDPHLFDLERPSSTSVTAKRNRRVVAFFLILAGAVIGGFVSDMTGQVQMALWIAGALKFILAMAFFFWPVSGEGLA